MPNFSIPLSGLTADSFALNTIGNNLSNLDTTAYKGQHTEFEDLFYQQFGANGSGDTLQVGVGTKVQSTATDFSQGSINPTGVTSDLALTGDGFFVVQTNGVQQLTRAGNFQLDSLGNFITAEGASVMGYPANSAGTITPSGSLVPLTVPVGLTEAAQATANVGLTTNLDASATAGTTYSTNVTLYDSLGDTHLATVTFTKSPSSTTTGTPPVTTATPNQWTYAITLPSGDATGTPVNNTGTLIFNSSGLLTSPTANVTGVTFPGLADGASNLDFNFNLYDSSGNGLITQTNSSSATNANTQDGFAAGTYQNFTVSPTGVLTVNFSNGQQKNVGQVAVATVLNNEGLTITGDNNYMTTAASGQINPGVAGTGSRGTITDSALELSNVDISTEFANLIVAQRDFEANSKTVTTFDTVTQDTIAMVR
jgi:flagellar hook protein FlgE